MSVTDMIRVLEIPLVGMIPSFKTADELLAYVAPLKGIEGFVVAFPDGRRFKSKAEEYVRIHKVKDKIRSNRHILMLILDNALDDVLPHLDEGDLKSVQSFEFKFWHSLSDKITHLGFLAHVVINSCDGSKKEIALRGLKQFEVSPEDKPFIFGYADNKDMREMVLRVVVAGCSSNIKFDNMWKWLTS
jgi:hypothetical protein